MGSGRLLPPFKLTSAKLAGLFSIMFSSWASCLFPWSNLNIHQRNLLRMPVGAHHIILPNNKQIRQVFKNDRITEPLQIKQRESY